MDEEFLAAYNRELDALRNLSQGFADAHPKVAGRLRLNGDIIDDPHVERLLEGVAFLSARVQQRLDDELPEITDALLGVLSPHALAPVPSAAIVQLACKPELRVPVTIPAGTMLESEPVAGDPVRFRTAYATTLWPIEIEAVRLSGLPLAAPVNPRAQGARASLRVSLRLTDPEATFAELEPRALRVFLRGPIEQALALYELLGGHVAGVALADGPNDDRPTLLPPDSIRPAGFAPEEALYPWTARSFEGFRLLTEYFALPEKFLFVDLVGLDARTLIQDSDRLDLFVYFDQAAPELERRLRPDCLALGCTPIVNLFTRHCEPITLDGTRTEYPILPDYRRPKAYEVWSVEAVHEVADDGAGRPWRPFYRRPAALGGEEPTAGYYAIVRRDATDGLGGSDVLLAPFDPDLQVNRPADRVLSVDATCTSRDLPAQLPFGVGQPRLFPAEGLSSIARITCLTAPTASWRPRLRRKRNWRLISHLSLGHLSIVGGADAAAAMRDMLQLYDVRDTPHTRAAIAALLEVSASEATARVPGARLGSFCRGLDVTLTFDRGLWASGGLYLLAAVLERFLALHATVNSFTRTQAVLQGRSGTVARFAPRAGAQVLL
ncbi:type VI secretion system protein ImpG [Methylobacterium variabile]|uniref:Type VI secretion system protein ImpG n=1 Tax=Methylobacterium variabile TaxID=298794 RepID=A0A0J6V3W3_9HYPH|nr:type VI secretion system baseplate subunit TssF [Methylobacterium variabile]KMO33551.1 type VI secretion system protein ImpG [Methylobacterium variabile]